MIVLSFIMAANIGLRVPPSEAERRFVVESAVLAELNRARTSPAAFASSLRDQRGWYHGNLLLPPGADEAFLVAQKQLKDYRRVSHGDVKHKGEPRDVAGEL